MRIGELAARTGVSVRSLRYYEEQGLLNSTRSIGGQRRYSEDAIARVAYLRRLFAAGLSSRTIFSLLPCLESPSKDHRKVAFARLVRERDRLTTRIAELSRTRDSLDELIAINRAMLGDALGAPESTVCDGRELSSEQYARALPTGAARESRSCVGVAEDA